MIFLKQIRRLFFILLYAGGAYATVSAQIFTDNRRTFSYTDDSTVMPGDVKVLDILFEANCRYYVEYYDTLVSLANFLVKHPNIQVLITVHTDSRGSAEANRKLSTCRAEEYGRVFKSKNVPAGQYRLEGKGEDEPLIPQETIDATPDEETRERFHKINRRTEVKIISVSLK